MTPSLTARSMSHFALIMSGFAVLSGGLMVNSDAAVSAEPASSQSEISQLFEAKTFKSAAEFTLPYRLLSPAAPEAGKRYPVLLFLHGAGERGSDNEKQLVHVVQELAKPEMRERYPCYLVVPQCPEEIKWVDVDWTQQSHTLPETPSQPLVACYELLAQLEKEYSVDANRIYIGGLSMGGYGTWDALARWPERFAAAIPICGGGDPAQARRMVAVPTWVFHGDQDLAVPVGRSREMVHAIREHQGQVIYTEYPNVGHNSWAMTAANRLVWDWLFAQSRKD